MSPTLLALIICLAAAGLERALVGGDARQWLAQLRMPAYSPPFSLWLVIGGLYYTICFVVLRHLLASRPFDQSRFTALVLVIVLLLTNALWNVLFFRWRDLRASFIAFIPCAAFVAALVALLVRLYPFGAVLWGCYCLYFLYATWWGYRLWRLNAPKPDQTS
jgi:tryptophan-rich sensory protein